MNKSLESIIKEIKKCQICSSELPLGPNPVFRLNDQARILIIGQAPGIKVHKSGIPWDDASGKELRRWLGVSVEEFYNPALFGIMPMGFCYPGTGKSGDLPPRKECATQWHESLWEHMKKVELVLLIGKYAQDYYLPASIKSNTLTENVSNFELFLPRYLPLPHPSPRNRMWMSRNPWFEEVIVPFLQEKITHMT